MKLYAPGSKSGVLVTGQPKEVSLPPPFDRVPTPPGHEIHHKYVVCGVNGQDPVVWCGSSNLATGGEESNGDNLLEIHDAEVAMTFAIEALLLVDHYNFLDRFAAPPKAQATTAPARSKAAAKKATGSAVKKAVKRASAKKAAAKKTTVKQRASRKAGAKKAVKKSASRRGSARTASLRSVAQVARMMAPAKRVAAKKASTKKAASKAARKRVPAKKAAGRTKVTRMPQSLEKAATQAGIFLRTDDAWSLRYFDPNDLHSLERKLFG